MDSGISTEEDYPFQEQKWDYCKPKTKVYIYFRHIFIFVFMFIICSIKSFKRIGNGNQIAFCKQVAFYLIATTVHVFEEFEQLKR